jgi:tripartite-type tricarboxylate transporter receptor subunit TctC
MLAYRHRRCAHSIGRRAGANLSRQADPADRTFSPGSTADIASRFTAQELAKALGQPVVVENKAGAGGMIGTRELARAAPDGYTIGFASQGTLVFDQAIDEKPGYNSLKDFAPIALLGRASNVMVVHPSNPASTAADIIASAKSKPGALTFSSGGRGTSQHLSGVLFGRVTGISLVHVPYKSAPQAVLAVISNEVTMAFLNIPLVIGQIRDGKVRALGVTSLERSPSCRACPRSMNKASRVMRSTRGAALLRQPELRRRSSIGSTPS